MTSGECWVFGTGVRGGGAGDYIKKGFSLFFSRFSDDIFFPLICIRVLIDLNFGPLTNFPQKEFSSETRPPFLGNLDS